MKYLLLAIVAASMAAGCATTSVGADSKLDRLIGTWDGRATTTMTPSGETLEVRSTTTTEWARPGEVMLERTVSEVGEMTATALAVWVWDPAARACRTYRIHSNGLRETGLARHDGSGEVWELQSRSEDPQTGVVTSGAGSMRFTERDRKSYDWVTKVDGTKTAKVEGSSERQ